MSLIDRTKEFFGLGPMDIEADAAYYADERRYREIDPFELVATGIGEPRKHAVGVACIDGKKHNEKEQPCADQDRSENNEHHVPRPLEGGAESVVDDGENPQQHEHE